MSKIELTAEWDKEKQEVIRYHPPRRVCSFCYEGMLYDPQKGIWECIHCICRQGVEEMPCLPRLNLSGATVYSLLGCEGRKGCT